MITSHLNSPTHHSLCLVSKALRDLTTKPPKLSKQGWTNFNAAFERCSRRCPLSLACTMCMTLKTPASFSDSQARKTSTSALRFCLACGIGVGKYDNSSFKVGKVKSFACGGCKSARPLGEEDQCLENEAYKMWPLAPGGVGIAIERGVSRKGKRWCERCWGAIVRYMKGL